MLRLVYHLIQMLYFGDQLYTLQAVTITYYDRKDGESLSPWIMCSEQAINILVA
jgi:hypothetical protein